MYSETLHIQLTKRYTTVGMGPSQGRHSALAVARLVAKATNKTVSEIGVTTARPPFSPEKLGVLAGRSFYPERHSAMHKQHLEMGAQMLQAGAWMRPAFYGPAGTKDKSMQAESMNVRTNVGIVDVSTLGGIDVRGPDAAELIERIDAIFATRPLEEWSEIFDAEEDFFWAPVQSLEEALADPQMTASGGLVEVMDGESTVMFPATPADFGDAPSTPRSAAPAHG